MQPDVGAETPSGRTADQVRSNADSRTFVEAEHHGQSDADRDELDARVSDVMDEVDGQLHLEDATRWPGGTQAPV